MQRLLLLFPTLWDAKQLAACRAGLPDLDVLLAAPSDEECPWDFDVENYLTHALREHADISGVASTSDYPGAAMAAALAERLGIPGPPLASVLKAGHKYLARISQSESVPEAVPRFWLIDPRADVPASLAFPCFLKPVKGSFSIMTRRIGSPGELARFLDRPRVNEFLTYYVHLFDALLRLRPELEGGARHFLAEELLSGIQVTVEGYASGSEVTILGTVDSILDPKSKSFVRFDYPSSLSREVQERMAPIVQSAMRHLGWRDGFFNVEMMLDPTSGELSIIEINPRLCGQFADLHLHVDGTSTYEILADLALGQPVRRGRGGKFGAASSFPLRLFDPARALAVPDPGRIQEIESRFPGSLIWIEGKNGDAFDDFAFEDGQSARYGVVNVAGEDHKEVLSRFREIEAALGCRFTPLAPVTRRVASDPVAPL